MELELKGYKACLKEPNDLPPDALYQRVTWYQPLYLIQGWLAYQDTTTLVLVDFTIQGLPFLDIDGGNLALSPDTVIINAVLDDLHLGTVRLSSFMLLWKYSQETQTRITSVNQIVPVMVQAGINTCQNHLNLSSIYIELEH